jgi:hypothetical protein
MDIAIVASGITIFVTLCVLGYNLFQVTSAYGSMVTQIGQFKAYVQEEQLTPALMRRFNLILMSSLLGLYLLLLFFSGFAWWFLGLVLSKYLLTVWLSDTIHKYILHDKPFDSGHHRLIRFDAVGNVLVLSFVLVACIWA